MLRLLPRKSRNRADPNYPRMVFCLQLLQTSHSLVEVQFEGREDRQQSIVLDVNGRKGRFSLDAPHPALPSSALRKRAKLAVFARYRHRNIRFSCRLLGVTRDDRGVRYWCTIPEQFADAQRRDYFRLPVPDIPEEQVRLVVNPADTGFQPRRVTDLSEQGMRVIASCTQNVAPFEGAVFRGSLVLPDDRRHIEAKMAIRSVENSPREGGVLLGIAFSGIDRQDRKRLRTYILRRQRRPMPNDGPEAFRSFRLQATGP